MIRLENVSKVYKMGTTVVRALDGVDLTVERGEFVAIMGVSGSGKSTMMNIMGLLDRPTTGRYSFEGHDVAKLSDDTLARLRSRELGFVFQQFNLLNRMNALEQVELPLVYQHAKNRRKVARQALHDVGILDRAYHLPTQLSGGQQQRVAIARALVVQPRLILADEPTGALDSKTGEEVMALLTGLVRQRGITVILVTHEQTVADYADRIIRMQDGRIQSDQRKAWAATA